MRGTLPWVLPPSSAAAKSLQPCLTLCDPIDSSPPGSSVPGILQTIVLEWVAISFSIICQKKQFLGNFFYICPTLTHTHLLEQRCHYQALLSWKYTNLTEHSSLDQFYREQSTDATTLVATCAGRRPQAALTSPAHWPCPWRSLPPQHSPTHPSLLQLITSPLMLTLMRTDSSQPGCV